MAEFLQLWSLPENRFVSQLPDINIDHETFDRTPYWSPDGSKLLVNKGGEIYVWDVASSKLERTVRIGSSPDDYISGVQWSSDAESIRVFDAAQNLHTYQLERHALDDGQRLGLDAPISGVFAPAPSGIPLAAFFDETGRITIFDTRTGNLQVSLAQEATDAYPTGIQWTSAETLAISRQGGSIEFWDAATGQRLALVTDIPIGVRAFALNADATQLVVVGNTVARSAEETDRGSAYPMTILVPGAAVLVDLTR